MAVRKHNRRYDVVVFGATGYTGALVAEHIATRLPTDVKWAVAGRSAEKLEKVILDCKKLSPNRIQPEIELCNLNDADLLSLAHKSFALITTVGPYAKYGEHAFKACAEAGTHYIDCTGEAVWTSDMIKKYESRAQETGAMIFPQSGLESAPSDLLTWTMAQLIRSELSVHTSDVVVEIHKIDSAPSGGTLNTALDLVESYSVKQIAASHKPYALSPVPNPHPNPGRSMLSKLTGLYSIPHLGLLNTSIAAGSNTSIVQRTWGLLKQDPARQKEFYGPNFTYREFMKSRNALRGIITHYTIIIAGVLVFFVPAVRSLIRKFIYKPGEGPRREDTLKDYLELRGVANADSKENPRQAFVKSWYSGSIYGLTAMMLGQTALTLLQDDVHLGGGVFTPACLGQTYIDRLDDNGFKIEAKLLDA